MMSIVVNLIKGNEHAIESKALFRYILATSFVLNDCKSIRCFLGFEQRDKQKLKGSH